MRERLQKIIAQAGITSRRAAEALIVAGRVRVNGVVQNELGAKADPYVDKVELDGKRLEAERLVYLVLHKPRDVVSTLSDPEGRPTVADLLRSAGARVHPVGRLDFATSGVLLATNDGDFTQGMLHPKKDVPKTYVLKIQGTMAPDDLDAWREGIQLEDGRTLPAKARILRHEGDKTWIEVTLREGRNQQIRRMGDATRFPVLRLARISFAGITHEGLRPGDYRPLSASELKTLRDTYDVPKRVPKTVPTRPSTAIAVASRAAPKSGRTDRSGTKPREAAAPAPRARARVGRSSSRGRT